MPRHHFKTKHMKHLFIKKPGSVYQKLPYENICYITSSRDYVEIITKAAYKNHRILITMAELIKNLPENFMQVHRKFIVNVDKISSIQGPTNAAKLEIDMGLVDQYEIPVGVNHYKKLLNRFFIPSKNKQNIDEE